MNTLLKYILLIFLIGLSTSHTSTKNPFYIFDSYTHETNSNHTTNTFLVETKLSRNELEHLLMKAKNNPENVEAAVKEYKEAKKNKKVKMDPFEKAIEKEIKEDSLHPLDDFQVIEITEPVKEDVSTTTLIAKKNSNLFDKLYEKNMSNKIGFIALILVVISVFVFHNLYIKNGKKIYKKALYYRNEEYMLKNY